MVEGVPAKSPDLSEERKGPRVNAPEQAIAGFVKSAGLKSIKDAQVVKDDKKGDFYVVKIEKPGRGGQGDHRRGGAGRGGEVPVAQVDALGRGAHDLGAAAAFDRLPARRQGGAVRRSRRSRAARRRAGIASTATSRSR